MYCIDTVAPPEDFGGMAEPNWFDSVSALYIVSRSFRIKSKYYNVLFLINGVSSCLAHNPYVATKIPGFQKVMNSTDSLTIWYPFLTKSLFDLAQLSERRRLVLLTVCLLVNCKSGGRLNKIVSLPRMQILSVLLICIQLRKRLSVSLLVKYVMPALLTKVFENRDVVRCLGVKIHSVWHVAGTEMFSKLISERV